MRLEGLYLYFGEGLDEAANEKARARLYALLRRRLIGVTDLILGYASLYVEYDADRVPRGRVERWARAEEEAPPPPGRRVEIPVVYDGPDLKAVADWAGLSLDEVIRRHAAGRYRVFALGFTPGFPFMGVVEPALQKPRLPVPRPEVPAHAVGIAGPQTGVYPMKSPGGWNLIGRARVRVYDPGRAEPFLLAPGDEVRFVPDAGAVPGEPEGLELLSEKPRHPFLRVEQAGLLDLVVDRGRFLAGRFGLARSGPLDPYSAALANRLVGNPAGGTVLEVNLKGPELVALQAGVVGFAGYGFWLAVNGEVYPPAQAVRVVPGDRLTLLPRGRGARAYLALPGGIAHGAFLGSQSVDLRGKIGRPLRPGDVLGSLRPSNAARPRAFAPWPLEEGVVRLRVQPGPQATPEAVRALTEQTFTVERADRMGLRLQEGGVPGGEVTSEAVPIGAVQVPPGGRPMLLLADRGTLGGYAKPLVVDPRDLWRAGQLRTGDRLRFVLDFGP